MTFTGKIGRLLTYFQFLRTFNGTQSHETSRSGVLGVSI
jgi:hypothetical protein